MISTCRCMTGVKSRSQKLYHMVPFFLHWRICVRLWLCWKEQLGCNQLKFWIIVIWTSSLPSPSLPFLFPFPFLFLSLTLFGYSHDLWQSDRLSSLSSCMCCPFYTVTFSVPKSGSFFQSWSLAVLYLTVLRDTLEKRGALGHLKAQIRAEVFGVLDDDQEPRPTLSHENLLINELIREYLEFNKYKYTASVLMAGKGAPGSSSIKLCCFPPLPHHRARSKEISD